MKMRIIIILIVLATLGNGKLLLVQELSRHGARGTYGEYWNYLQSSELVGELSATGFRQQYNLGAQLREEYIHNQGFLNETFDPREIYIRSTDTNRTIQSAQSQLLGMYPKGKKIPKSLDKKFLIPPFLGAKDMNKELKDFALPHQTNVFPVHVVPQNQDYLLSPWILCNETKKLQQEYMDAHKIVSMKVDYEFARLYQKFSNILRVNVTSHKQFGGTDDGIYDVFICNEFNGEPNPKELNESDMNDIYFLNSFSSLFEYTGSKQATKILNTPFQRSLISYFEQKIKGSIPDLKWIMFSAHDHNLILAMNILNISSYQCLLDQKFKNNPYTVFTDTQQKHDRCEYSPGFASSLIWELHSTDGNESNDSHYIKVRYNGSFINLCGKETQICGFQEFKKQILNNISHGDFYKSCNK